MLQASNAVPQVEGVDPNGIPESILRSTQPVVLKGLVSHWPVVQAGLTSDQAASAYLRQFDGGATVGVWRGAPEIGGRFFYNDDFTGFNFDAQWLKLNTVLDELVLHRDDVRPPALYVGSTTVDTCLPGFRAANALNIEHLQPLVSLWIGNHTRIAAHFDLPDNLACVVAGHRRFTLFAPSELDNLYVGPLDFTPAGQAISLVDFEHPDYSRFPKFALALRNAWVAELGPGDAIFIPSMWWHHVHALDRFNGLVNYWWRQSPAYMDSPMNALMHALMSVRDLPPAQRAAWQQLFQHYVFEASEHTAAHIPPNAQRVLAPLDAEGTRVLRSQLLKKLNR